MVIKQFSKIKKHKKNTQINIKILKYINVYCIFIKKKKKKYVLCRSVKSIDWKDLIKQCGKTNLYSNTHFFKSYHTILEVELITSHLSWVRCIHCCAALWYPPSFGVQKGNKRQSPNQSCTNPGNLSLLFLLVAQLCKALKLSPENKPVTLTIILYAFGQNCQNIFGVLSGYLGQGIIWNRKINWCRRFTEGMRRMKGSRSLIGL